MPKSGRLGRGLRPQLLLRQSAAEDAYWHWRRLGNQRYVPSAMPPAPMSNPPRRQHLTCPLCGLRYPLDQMSVDHAPPKGGQSRLGPAVVAVLTCRKCNNGSGFAFEGTASAIQQGEITEDLTAEQEANLAALAVQVEQVTDVQLLVLPDALQLTDFKAAFLIAFATLGYGWALSDELRPVRNALRDGREPQLPYALGFVLTPGSTTAENVVLEVGGPHPCVLVLAGTGAGVAFPIPGVPVVPPLSAIQQIRSRRYPWPETAAHEKINEVEKAHRLGTLFHTDACEKHKWPVVSLTFPADRARRAGTA